MKTPIRVWPFNPASELILYQKLTSGFTGQIVTLNSLMFYTAYYHPELWNIISQAALVLPDSWGICWAIKKLCGVKVQRYPGIDFIDFLCRLARERQWRMFLLGSEMPIIELAAKKLKEQYPGLIISGFHHGYFPPEKTEDIVREIKNSQSQILLVGQNIVQQELFIGKNFSQLGVNIAVGVGGSFDVLSGKLSRAPDFLRKLGLEWLFRFYIQPWRIARIWKLPLFWQLIWRIKLSQKKLLTVAEIDHIYEPGTTTKNRNNL